MTLSATEARFLETRDLILARRNPELLKRENAEFEAMTDAELAALARPAPSVNTARHTNMFSAAEVERLRICEQTLARQNPKLLERMNADLRR
jgi:hypothetical protein